MMKSRTLFTLTFITLMLTSCGNGSKTFGDAHYYDESWICDVTYLVCRDKMYVRVGSPDQTPTTEECIACFDSRDNYSTKVYTLDETKYPGIIYTYSWSLVNLAKIESIYACSDATEIDASLLYDFPHRASFWDGDDSVMVDDVKYVPYGLTSAPFVPGERIEGSSYWKVPGYDNWIATESENDSSRYILLYEANSETLPWGIVELCNDIPSL